MEEEFEFECTHGSHQTESTGYYYYGWYCVHGSKIVNETRQEIFDGIDVEEINDIDCFTWSKPIESLEELINAVES